MIKETAILVVMITSTWNGAGGPIEIEYPTKAQCIADKVNIVKQIKKWAPKHHISAVCITKKIHDLEITER